MLLADKVAAYRAAYARQCALPENLQDELTLSYELGYHHYTLYYYDRGGNLMKTVPPAGVRLLAAGEKQSKHQLVTNYKYNSLGQLVEQTSPDGGTTTFYYNRIGQLRYSRNDKQRAEGKYSYTAYDALGRVIEVGQTSFEYTDDLKNPLSNIETLSIPPTGNEFVTRTTYSTPVNGLAYPAVRPDETPQPQRYLTNRVSSTTTSEGGRTSYSYDPHGNVEWLAQDVPGLPRKFVRYEYDLISNKVTQVAYQEGQPDQFFHRYRYDDDNRLLAVQTSADGQVWEQDAQYSYYPHGPLKRLVLGDDQVQALDYAYTLQGWLKGINHPNLNQNLTAGQAFSVAADGDGNNNGVAADAFGMTLGYYAGDYVRQGSYLNAALNTTAGKGVLPPDALAANTSGRSLYNGNIATWTSNSLEPKNNGNGNGNGSSKQVLGTLTGEVYQYDQLNRLLASQRHTGLGSVGTTGTYWSEENRPYSTSYNYDANGNLLKLTRRSNSASTYLDQLTYNYQRTADGQLLHNRLRSVNDGVKENFSDEDVDNQPELDNYRYDEVGNLIADKQAKASLRWTPYGKLAQVVRTGLNQTSYLYDAQGNRIRKQLTPGQGPAKQTYYVRDAQGNVLALYEQQDAQAPRLVEQPLYGSARLGERRPAALLATAPPQPGISGVTYGRVLGQKLYELSDHLGNVRVVVTDEKSSTLSQAKSSLGQPLNSSLQPVLSAYYNYYAFGQLQPGRYSSGSTGAGGYRYGYNGKEKDNNGELGLTNYDYGARIYNPGLGRFLSVDKDARKAPQLTPYRSSFNNPIRWVDKDGNFETDGHYWTVYMMGLMLGMKPSDAQHIAYITEQWDTKIHDTSAELNYTWAIPTKQQQIHALTGRSQVLEEFVTAIAFLNCDPNSDDVGLYLHRYGDTYAHSRLSGSGMMYGSPDNYTVEHKYAKEEDGTNTDVRPDKIYERPELYKKYVRNLASLMSVKYGLDQSKVNFNVFDELANYAAVNKVSLIGIINYQVAKMQGQNSFVIQFARGATAVEDINDHDKHVMNTDMYLEKIGVKVYKTPLYTGEGKDKKYSGMKYDIIN